MNKNIAILMLILLCSCKNSTENKEYTILSGKIKNPTKTKEFFVKSLEGFSKNIKIDNNGNFTDTLFVDSGVYDLYTDHNFTTVYLTKGANIALVIDENNADSTFVFSGEEAAFNNYYVNKSKIVAAFSANNNKLFALNEADFEREMNNHQKKSEQNLENYKTFPEEIKKSELRSLNYSRLLQKMIYKDFHGKFIRDEKFQTSTAFNKELIGIDMNDSDDYFYSSSYRNIVNRIVSNQAFKIYKKEALPYDQAFFKMSSEIKNQRIKNDLLFTNIQSSLPYSDNKKKSLDQYLSLSTNKMHNSEIQKLYNTVVKLEKGKPSPIFKNYENYDGSTTSLNDFRGKYVYIDVWATWCGPCMSEIPLLKKIEEQYHGKNILFVSISVDAQKDKSKWKEMIKKKAMTGIQLITDNEFNTEFIKGYAIEAIPRFILLDPKGNIVDSNTLRPSDDKDLKEFFDGLNLVNL